MGVIEGRNYRIWKVTKFAIGEFILLKAELGTLLSYMPSIWKSDTKEF